ncbi:MAG TPA: hypothetical protein VIM05_00790 [Gaiellaceae bacterium]
MNTRRALAVVAVAGVSAGSIFAGGRLVPDTSSARRLSSQVAVEAPAADDRRAATHRGRPFVPQGHPAARAT